MPLPIEVDSRASVELSAAIESMVNDPEIEEPVTLGFVRERLKDALGEQRVEDEQRLQFGNEQSLYAEVLRLIEEYGDDVLAIDFVAVKASDNLSEVIQALIDDSDEDTALTLGGVREAITQGCVARLAGAGIIDCDEDETLLEEVEALIGRYGEDTLAEDMLRFE